VNLLIEAVLALGCAVLLLLFGKDGFDWAGEWVSDIAKAYLVYIVLFLVVTSPLILSRAAWRAYKLPQPPARPADLCKEFYNLLLQDREHRGAHGAFVCLTDSAQATYGSLDDFLRQWKEYRKTFVAVLEEFWVVRESEPTSERITWTVDMTFRKLDNSTIQLRALPALIQTESGWLIDSPFESSVPQRRRG